jgi:hypothetical protein
MYLRVNLVCQDKPNTLLAYSITTEKCYVLDLLNSSEMSIDLLFNLVSLTYITFLN